MCRPSAIDREKGTGSRRQDHRSDDPDDNKTLGTQEGLPGFWVLLLYRRNSNSRTKVLEMENLVASAVHLFI